MLLKATAASNRRSQGGPCGLRHDGLPQRRRIEVWIQEQRAVLDLGILSDDCRVVGWRRANVRHARQDRLGGVGEPVIGRIRSDTLEQRVQIQRLDVEAGLALERAEPGGKLGVELRHQALELALRGSGRL